MSAATSPRGFSTDGAGVWCQDATPGMVNRLATAGFDWVGLDLQHGLYDRASMIAVARAYPSDAAELVVRVASLDFAAIDAALDAGATGVIVPQIETAEQAAQAVAASFYPPVGARSWGQLGSNWGRSPVPPDQANAQTRCAVMIESADGLAHVEEIAAVPGLSMIFVGPFDLALSLGTTVSELLADRSPSSPISRITAAARSRGVLVAAFAGKPEDAERFRAHGITCLVVATDLWVTQAGARVALPDVPSEAVDAGA